MQFALREFAMMITRRELLETSIAQLQTLAAFLNDQLGESADDPAELETDACCKEILRALDELIHNHQSARSAL
jgi:hypothetical protein